jgi:hypothetical protein
MVSNEEEGKEEKKQMEKEGRAAFKIKFIFNSITIFFILHLRSQFLICSVVESSHQNVAFNKM